MVPVARKSGTGAIILTCSDPRLNPYAIFGIDPSIRGVTMIRNAGGRAFDAIRTMSVLQTIGHTKTVIIMHHNGEFNIQERPGQTVANTVYIQIAE